MKASSQYRIHFIEQRRRQYNTHTTNPIEEEKVENSVIDDDIHDVSFTSKDPLQTVRSSNRIISSNNDVVAETHAVVVDSHDYEISTSP